MKTTIYYSDKIDPVIYSDFTTLFTDGDWVELAIAALDQAGAKVDLQHKIREIVEEKLLK